VRKLLAYLVKRSRSQLRGRSREKPLQRGKLIVLPWEPNSREPSALHDGTQSPSVMDRRMTKCRPDLLANVGVVVPVTSRSYGVKGR
jgi:hypothetical protein